jgi:hypothetical protein
MSKEKRVPKWTPEREAQLVAFVDGVSEPISQDIVAEAAVELETTNRSISSKLRKMGKEVESAATAVKAKSFTADEENDLRSFLEANQGVYTFAEIAEEVFGGEKSAKQVQGKILSMELTQYVKPTEPKVIPAKYTEEETDKIVDLMQSGAYLEDIAEALDRELNSIRGKVLSLLKRAGTDMPKQKNHKVNEKADALKALGEGIADMTVAQIAEAIEKTERGVKVMLTSRGINCADYKGADKRAKRDEKKAADAA